MAFYRFRVADESRPESVWRDVVVGGKRSLAEFQSEINLSLGLDQTRTWFFGPNCDYWHSDVVYTRPEFVDQTRGGMEVDGEHHDASETTIGDVVRQLDLAESDRICYLFDFDAERRFSATIEAIEVIGCSHKGPKVVDEKGMLEINGS
ncbi:MAG: hypothetical protein ABEJ44_01250 [Halanaeroarchaeum sp.]